jgi:hypothetical protein
LNKSKLPLRSVLQELASSFADAVIAAARDAIFEMPRSRPFAELPPRAAQPRRAQRPRGAQPLRAQPLREDARVLTAAVAASPLPAPAAAPRSRAARAPRTSGAGKAGTGRTRVSHDTASSNAPSDLLITDPQLLLAAIDTAGPQSVWETNEEPVRRAAPAILAPVTPAPAAVEAPPVRDFTPMLREGEVIVRRSAAGVVLRRRRA